MVGSSQAGLDGCDGEPSTLHGCHDPPVTITAEQAVRTSPIRLRIHANSERADHRRIGGDHEAQSSDEAAAPGRGGAENTGERLPPQLVPTLVEPFQRGTGRIRDGHAGLGLGLAIVRSITQAHDGTLALAPREAGGLGVTVRLPRAPADPG
jgi:light-regulated signal transduction histidine kinase (bacteriophytochrome)